MRNRSAWGGDFNVIVERQSPPWGSPSFDADQASALIARQLHGEGPARAQFEAYTRGLHTLWDSTFPITFSACRQFLKLVAHDTWGQVRNCSAIHAECSHGEVVHSVFGGPGWILFTDDDDWFAPDVFERVDTLANSNHAACLVWQRARFNGAVDVSPLYPTERFKLWVYTNNYAVRARLFARGTPVDEVMQHGLANDKVAQHQWPTIFVQEVGLSVTNKSPCSWNALNQAKQSADPTAHLIELVQRYSQMRVELEPSMQWMAPHVARVQNFFRDMLGSC